MRSSSRNSRRSIRASGLAAVVSMLTATAALATDQADHKFVLTAYANGKGGVDLVTGNYDDAARELHYQAGLSAFDKNTTSNNRCVFLAVTKQWDSARAACDTAVRDAQRELSAAPTYQSFARENQDENLAVALSNRAVLHWLSSESEAAASDLKRARKLSPRAEFVTRNTRALEYARTPMAQVESAPSSP